MLIQSHSWLHVPYCQGESPGSDICGLESTVSALLHPNCAHAAAVPFLVWTMVQAAVT